MIKALMSTNSSKRSKPDLKLVTSEEDVVKEPCENNKKQYLKDLFSLAKPNIIPLLLVSMLCPMVVADPQGLDLALVFWSLIGGTLVTSSAQSLNCIWDRDIDSLMNRTQKRVLVQGSVPLHHAYFFSAITLVLGMSSFLFFVNIQAAFWSLFGHLFYVLIYTMWLKRTTVQNIVIGGAAGAVPPIVGWSAVTGDFSWEPFWMFMLIFLWTPPHFWALALVKNADYQRAGVPMMPVLAGTERVVWEMKMYAISLFPVSVALVFSAENLGWFSFCSMIALCTYFLISILKLEKVVMLGGDIEKSSWTVFYNSLFFLSFYFFASLVDALLI